MEAMITQIQRFSVGDGPGIRSTVFFKGCNLHCPWCHNPETISAKPQLMLYAGRCTHCGACARICPVHQVSAEIHEMNRAECAGCGRCVGACPSGALSLCGEKRTTEEIMRVILEDLEFYRESAGGVTLSGGEPLLQAAECAELAAACRSEKISVLLDTAGNVGREAFERVIPLIDMCYFDLKSGQAEGYEKIGGNLGRTMENLSHVAGKVETVARIPVIPGFNDSPEELEKMALLLEQTSVVRVDLLPFHRMGTGKYQALNREYAYAETEPMKNAYADGLLEVFRARGLKAARGG